MGKTRPRPLRDATDIRIYLCEIQIIIGIFLAVATDFSKGAGRGESGLEGGGKFQYIKWSGREDLNLRPLERNGE